MSDATILMIAVTLYAVFSGFKVASLEGRVERLEIANKIAEQK